jgi:hypothetical protein
MNRLSLNINALPGTTGFGLNFAFRDDASRDPHLAVTEPK